MLEPQLYTHTVRLLKHRPPSLSLKKISQETGINVRILQLMENDYPHIPRVTTVEILYLYLTGEPLELGELSVSKHT